MSLLGHKIELDAFGIAREYFPKADNDDLGFILWNYTGYPGFWDGEPEACLRAQLEAHKAALDSEAGG